MGNLLSSNKKTPTEQLEGGSQVDAPEATVPVSTEEQESPVDEQQLEKKDETGATCGTISEETAAEVQHEVAEEQKIEPTTGSSPKLLEFCISVSAAVSGRFTGINSSRFGSDRDLVRPPFEDEKDTKIREQKEEIRQKDEIIARRNEEISTLKNELAKKSKLIKQLKTKNEPKLIELFRNRRNSKSSWQRFIYEGSRMLSDQLGGAGHFFGHDNTETRDPMYEEEELKLVLRLLAAGEKNINFKFWWSHNWNVAEAGWTIQFKPAREDFGGDGKYFHLSLERKAGRAKFKATAQQIDPWTGEEENRRELQSETDGTRQRIKYEMDRQAGCFVRFNIKFL